VYLLVEETLAHGAGGARDGRNGLGGRVGHDCGGRRTAVQLGVSGGLATAVGGRWAGWQWC
jgi:hypothetical protein